MLRAAADYVEHQRGLPASGATAPRSGRRPPRAPRSGREIERMDRIRRSFGHYDDDMHARLEAMVAALEWRDDDAGRDH